MESGLRPAGCRPPLTSLFRQILRTLGAQNRREDTNLAKAGFLILALHGTVGLFFTFRDSESAGSGKRNMKSGSEKSPDRFFLSGKEYLRLAEDGQSGGNDESGAGGGRRADNRKGQQQQKNSGGQRKTRPCEWYVCG